MLALKQVLCVVQNLENVEKYKKKYKHKNYP